MTRTPPGPPPPIAPRPDQTLVTQVRRYRLITPLFGGGVEPGAADPVTVVRASQIRGHLRFWWRATRGGQFGGSLEQMRDAENRIWGTTSAAGRSGQSRVQVVVEVDPATVSPARDDLDHPYEVVRNREGRDRIQARDGSRTPAYAAFPLQTPPLRPVRHNVAFALRITYPVSEAADVTAALWAWETFGGLGARTRRGFGALHLDGIDGQPVAVPPLDQLERWLRQQLELHVSGPAWPIGVPHLSRDQRACRVIWHSEGHSYGWWQATEAWQYLIEALQSFRQWRARSSRNRPGRSYWPEPDAIRRHVRRHSPGHEPRITIDKYPRAAFGLPIVVHFKDARAGDPEDVTILGRDAAGRPVERLASPLILRPSLGRWQDQDLAVGLAVVLAGSTLPSRQLSLERRDARGREPEPIDGSALTPAEAAQLGLDRQLLIGAVRDNAVDLLQVFLNYLERGG